MLSVTILRDAVYMGNNLLTYIATVAVNCISCGHAGVEALLHSHQAVVAAGSDWQASINVLLIRKCTIGAKDCRSFCMCIW